VTGVIGIDSLVQAIGEKFQGAVAERNIAAARAAFALACEAREAIGA
jgi:Pyruvate/2-oxoacid:ferredoxin oxidoreductase gamma subunit